MDQTTVSGLVQAHVMLRNNANIRTMFPALKRRGCTDAQLWAAIDYLRTRGLQYEPTTGQLVLRLPAVGAVAAQR